MLLRLVTMIALAATVSLPCSVGSYRVLWTKNPRSTAPLYRFVDSRKIGFVDASGKVVIPAQFDLDPNATGDFVEGLARIAKNGKWGFIDPSGRMIVKTDFKNHWNLSDFSDGVARVLSSEPGQGFGYIDKTGTLVIPTRFASAEDFSDGLAAFSEPHRPSTKGNMGYRGRAGYIDLHGAVVIQPRFAFAGPFREGVARVAVDGKCWSRGYAGRLAAPSIPMMTSCGNPADDVTELCKQGFIDKAGSMVIAARFSDAGEFHETLAAVRENGLWGFINHAGYYVIKPQFEEALPFSEGLAPVKQNGLWGFIDHDGTLVIPTVYTYAAGFADGVAQVRKDNTLGYIDKVGAWVVTAPSGLASSFSFGLAHARLADGRYGYFDKSGKLVFEYRSAH